jgi:cytidine deaminase
LAATTDRWKMAAKAARSDKASKLDQAARDVLKNAYSKYSGFSVGAALRTAAGTVYRGCNVENVSFSITTCAERNALAAAIAAEGPSVVIAEMVILAENNGKPAPCSPCGACRQAIAEIAPQARLRFRNEALQLIDVSLNDLLPGAFSFNPAG